MKIQLFDTDNWREIFSTLSRNKTRTFLTAFGIFWGTFMLALLWGGSGGLTGMLGRQLQGIQYNTGGVMGGTMTISYKGFNKGTTWSNTVQDVEDWQQQIPQIKRSTGVLNRSVTATAGSKTASATVTGIQPAYFDMNSPLIISGRLLNDADVANERKVTVLGETVANTLFPEGDALGRFVLLGTGYFKVVGVVTDKSEMSLGTRLRDSAIIPYTVHKRAFNTGKYGGFYIFEAENGVRPSDLKPELFRIIAKNHSVSPDDIDAMDFVDVSEMMDQIHNVFMGVSLVALFVGLGSLFAGIIGVGNIMWIIVKERTREIGVRRAIGAHPMDIVLQIISEGAVLTSIAGLLGISFATIVLGVADKATSDPVLGNAGFELHLWQAIGITAVFIVLGTLAGVIPALKSLKIKPVEAMRDR